MTEQEKYYSTMNLVLAPVRLLEGFVQTIFYIVALAVVGLLYPLIAYMNHKPLTVEVFAIPVLVILTIFTLFYATYYLIFGGMAFLFGWAWWIIVNDAPSGDQTLWVCFSFITFGILQRFVRHCLYDPPKCDSPSFTQQLNQTRLEVMTKRFDALDRETRAEMIRQHGDNYFAWPEPW